MRLWHYALLPYLPNAQFKGQLRELVLILHDWRDRGQTNHLLINRVMDYDKREFVTYALYYVIFYNCRYFKGVGEKIIEEFYQFAETEDTIWAMEGDSYFNGWHNKEYLRVCMANLYEKWKFGRGKSHITDEEWKRLCDGYKKITGDEYVI